MSYKCFTEQAKKLLKSGAIKVDACNKSKQFKRARIDRGVMSKVSCCCVMMGTVRVVC